MKPTCLTLLLLLPSLAAQSPAHATFGSALTPLWYLGGLFFSGPATCNGVSGGTSWTLPGGSFDGWSPASLAADYHIAWVFRGGSRVVDAIQLRADYGGPALYGPNYLLHYSLDYTTDPAPQLLGGTWLPLTLTAAVPAGAVLTGNEVTYPTVGYPVLNDTNIQFQPVAATAVRLRVFPNGGTPASSGNYVLTEVSFATTVPGLVLYGNDSSCAGSRTLTVNGVPQLGDAGFAWQAPRAPVNGLGLLFVSDAALPAALPVFGIDVWIAPATALGLTTTANAWGTAQTPFPLPGNPALVGFQVAGQYVWLEACGPNGLTASGAGRITLQ